MGRCLRTASSYPLSAMRYPARLYLDRLSALAAFFAALPRWRARLRSLLLRLCAELARSGGCWLSGSGLQVDFDEEVGCHGEAGRDGEDAYHARLDTLCQPRPAIAANCAAHNHD